MARPVFLAAAAALVITASGCAGEPPPRPEPEVVRKQAPPAEPEPATAMRVEGERMSAKQIRAALVGRQLVARNLDTDTVNTVWLTPDKRVKWVKGDRNTFGSWRVEGDRLCFRYDDPSRDSTCTEVYRQAAGEYLSVVEGQPQVRLKVQGAR